MITSILVLVEGTEGDTTHLAAAIALAHHFRAHLDVLHVRPDPVEVAAVMGNMSAGIVSAQLMESLEAMANKRETAAKQLFDRACAREKLDTTPAPPTAPAATLSWLREIGDEASWVIRHGRTADLLVIGRAAPGSSLSTETLEAALLEAGRPIYIPGPQVGDPETVAIAWKSTREAALALIAAAPFLEAARRVVVLTAAEEAVVDQDDANRLVSVLRLRGLNVEARHLAADSRASGARLLAAAAEANAGLLVMGGYGHNRLREWIFGGVTDMVLRRATVPVLMAH